MVMLCSISLCILDAVHLLRGFSCACAHVLRASSVSIHRCCTPSSPFSYGLKQIQHDDEEGSAGQWSAAVFICFPRFFFSIRIALDRLWHQINRLEEWHNVDATVAIDGYHDIRDADLTVKVCVV